MRVWEWSETSQTAVIFCRGIGMVRVLAKGSRRPKSPYDGGLEPLTMGEAGVIVRPTSELALLTEWRLTRVFPAIRRSLSVYNAGLYAVDLLQHAIHDHDPHKELFDASVEALRLLESPADVGPALLKLQWSVLVETGYKPELDADVSTGEPIAAGEDAGALHFTPSLGGFTKEAPSAGDVGHASASTWRVRAGTLALLQRLHAAGLAGVGTGGATDAINRANRLLASYIRHVLGQEPPTMRLVFGDRLSR